MKKRRRQIIPLAAKQTKSTGENDLSKSQRRIADVSDTRTASDLHTHSGPVFDVMKLYEDFKSKEQTRPEDESIDDVIGTSLSRSLAHSKRFVASPPQAHNWIAFDLGDDDIALPRFSGTESVAQLVHPSINDRGMRTWKIWKGPKTVVHGLMLPKILGSCEDAPPLCFAPVLGGKDITFLGVFDGMGGAGAQGTDFEIRNIRVKSSQAMLASRLARLTLEKEIVQDSIRSAAALKERIRERLDRAESFIRMRSNSRIRGTLTKRLPTTLVFTQVKQTVNRSRITTWWAGDSRAFLVTPTEGLTALTADHVESPDQLEQLRTDPPVKNVVNQSTDFFLEESTIDIDEPYVVLLATDGVFGYLPTPGILELGLLESLSAGANLFANRFGHFCAKFAADDLSATVLVNGFNDDKDVAFQFRDRLRVLRNQYKLILGMTTEDENWKLEVERLWAIERPIYQRLSRLHHG